MRIEEIDRTNCYRFAVMGCTYGNVPALRACLDDARERGADVRLFLGDAIGCCGHSDEVLDLVRREFDAWLAGNLEKQAASKASTCGCGFASDRDEAISGRAFRYALESLSDRNRDWIGGWPDLIRTETGSGSFLFCHGSPRRTNEFLYESTLPEKPWRQWCEKHGVRGVFCAHTGFPWVRQERDHVIANCGATGKPDHDGDPSVHYATLDVRPSSPEVRLHRVEYDYGSWVEHLAGEGVDEIYRTPLAEGRWTYGLSRVPERELQERTEAVENGT